VRPPVNIALATPDTRTAQVRSLSSASQPMARVHVRAPWAAYRPRCAFDHGFLHSELGCDARETRQGGLSWRVPHRCLCLLSALGTRLTTSSVSGAKNPALVGVGGIVVHETENAFRVITKNDEAKRKP
jgi:hypothetical protein